MLILMTIANVGIKTYVDSSDRGATGHENMIINDENLIRNLIKSQLK